VKSIRYLLVPIVIALYLVPYLEGRAFKKGGGLKTRAVVQERIDGGASGVPYYSEGFVNAERPGTICHVSSVTPSGEEGGMACVWYSGSREGARDVAIYYSEYSGSGPEGEWSRPVVLVDRKTCSDETGRYVKKIGNPVIFRNLSGRLWLFYASVFEGGWSMSTLNYKVSPDGGRTWSRSEKLCLSPFFNLTNNVKNKPVLLDDGSFLLPVYHEFASKLSQLVWFRPGDGRAEYEVIRMTAKRRAIQPAIVSGGGKELFALFRNMDRETKRHVLVSRSADMGASWSQPAESPLPNPNSGLDAIGFPGGGILSVLNDSFDDRSRLSIAVSGDGGDTWRVLRTLENSAGQEYSYPSIARGTDGIYHVTYTFERRRIKHVAFNAAWLMTPGGADD
jgi:predicted neuraminidase